MAERISDASKDVFWYLLCFAFVLLFSFLGILHKSAIKRENATEVCKKNSLIISSSRVTLFMMTLLG